MNVNLKISDHILIKALNVLIIVRILSFLVLSYTNQKLKTEQLEKKSEMFLKYFKLPCNVNRKI